MTKVQVKKVSSNEEMTLFVRFPFSLYRGCEQFVPDLNRDVYDTFNPKKNSALTIAKVQPFLAWQNGEVVGRIAGIINQNANKKWGTKNVRFGFIDFIDDLDVSRALIEAVEKWGAEQGMERIQGPMGITDFDKEGMLVEDFEREGMMTEIYNYPYYPEHMKALGFEKEADWLHIRVAVPAEVPAKYARVAALSGEMFGLHVVKYNSTQLLGEKGHEVFRLMNKAYEPLFGFTAFTENQINDFLKQYVPIIDTELIPCVVNEDDELVAAAVTIPSLSKAMKKVNGHLLPLGWWHIMRALKWRHEDTVQLLLIAVRPDLQGMGVNALIFNDLIPVFNRKGFRYAETGPQLEDNVKELSQWKPLGPEKIKRRRCWCKEIGK
ncbi:MAG: N-acetyltransferase [Bacteroidaceae bacterium]|nr:N-acetyltransferase [Bacteroidaceae bacterium]